MRLLWTNKALQQLINAQTFISKDNPHAAKQAAERIVQDAYLLLHQPDMGRPGRASGTREWVVTQTPYLLIYRIDNETLQILRVIHSKQDWPHKDS